MKERTVDPGPKQVKTEAIQVHNMTHSFSNIGLWHFLDVNQGTHKNVSMAHKWLTITFWETVVRATIF